MTIPTRASSAISGLLRPKAWSRRRGRASRSSSATDASRRACALRQDHRCRWRHVRRPVVRFPPAGHLTGHRLSKRLDEPRTGAPGRSSGPSGRPIRGEHGVTPLIPLGSPRSAMFGRFRFDPHRHHVSLVDARDGKVRNHRIASRARSRCRRRSPTGSCSGSGRFPSSSLMPRPIRLAQSFSQLLRDETGHHIAGTTCCERHNDANGPRWIALRSCAGRQGRERGHTPSKMQKLAAENSHTISPECWRRGAIRRRRGWQSHPRDRSKTISVHACRRHQRCL
jgi:hypothetical protein